MREMVLQQQEGEEKWLKHYSSLHQILLVGDGDFSFSLCLANSFGSASNILASSLDSYDEVTKKYKNAKSNLEKLEHLGATILHGVNARIMKAHTDLRMRKFDRIIFNFPHAGFHGKEVNTLLIQMHRNLISGFFRNASGMLRADGEIHVNHKTTAPFCHWNLTGLASKSSLILFECVDFNIADYPGYNQKRGDGARCDEPFPLGKCSTFKFVFSPRANKIANSLNHNGLAQRPPRVMSQLSTTLPRVQEAPCQMPKLSTTLPRVQEAPCQMPQLSTTVPRVLQAPCPVPQLSTTLPRVLQAPCPMPKLSTTLPRVQEAPCQMPQLSTTFRRVLQAPCPMPQVSTTFDAPYSFNAHSVMNGSSHRAGLLQTSENEGFQILGGYCNHVRETFGMAEYNIQLSVRKELEHAHVKYMVERPGSSYSGYVNRSEQLHHLSRLRSTWLRDNLFCLDQQLMQAPQF